MKTLLVSAAAAALLTGSALAQGSISAPNVHRRALAPESPSAQYEGGLQRGARVGSPVQMFSPFAPAEYGDGHEFLVPRDQDVNQRTYKSHSSASPIALRLFSIAF